MIFEYLTPEEVAEHGLSLEEAEWEEAALKREAAQDQALTERLQALTERLQRLAAHQWARVREIEEEDFLYAQKLGPRPQLVLIRGGKDDNA
jgi:hypothetical protein